MTSCTDEETILASTTLESPTLCPEISLHLLRTDAEIWIGSPACPNPPTPYWGIAWGAGQALARWILDHAETVRNQRVYDLGAGSGIVSIAAALAGAAVVTAVDSDPRSVKAIALNAKANGVSVRTILSAFAAVPLDGTDVVLASDVGYAGAETIAYLRHLASTGQSVIVAEPERRGAELLESEIVATYEIRAQPATEAFFIRRAFVARL